MTAKHGLRPVHWPAPGDACGPGGPICGRVQKWGFGVIGFALMALLPIYTPGFLDTPGVSFDGVMAQFAMIALVAIGLNVVVGQAGLLDLGYVGFYAVGAYTVALLTSPTSPWNRLGPTGFFSKDWAWLSCVPLAMAFTALAGLILGFPTLRLRGDYLAIVTLGFGEIIRLLADNLNDITNGSRGLGSIAFPRFGEDSVPGGFFSSGNAMGATQLRNVVVLAGSHPGRHHAADRRATWSEAGWDAPGWPSGRTRTPRKSWASTPSSSSCGPSSSAPESAACPVPSTPGQVQFVAPTNFNIINSMLFLSAVVLGGQGNKLGVIFGAFMIVYLPNRLLGVHLFGVNLGDLKYLFFGLALVLLMIFRPQGLFPVRQQLLAYGKRARELLRGADDSKAAA